MTGNLFIINIFVYISSSRGCSDRSGPRDLIISEFPLVEHLAMFHEILPFVSFLSSNISRCSTRSYRFWVSSRRTYRGVPRDLTVFEFPLVEHIAVFHEILPFLSFLSSNISRCSTRSYRFWVSSCEHIAVFHEILPFLSFLSSNISRCSTRSYRFWVSSRRTYRGVPRDLTVFEFPSVEHIAVFHEILPFLSFLSSNISQCSTRSYRFWVSSRRTYRGVPRDLTISEFPLVKHLGVFHDLLEEVEVCARILHQVHTQLHFRWIFRHLHVRHAEIKEQHSFRGKLAK